MNTTDKHTTKNLIALDFMSYELKKGSFTSFSDENIERERNFVLDEFLNKTPDLNDKPILAHWHRQNLLKLKRRVLNKLINA